MFGRVESERGLAPGWRQEIGLGLVMLLGLAVMASAQEVSGTVTDPSGGRVAGATVTLEGGATPRETRTAADGTFRIDASEPGRYRLSASAPGFEPATAGSFVLSRDDRRTVALILSIGSLRQAVSVTASAGGSLAARTGAPVTVIDDATRLALGNPDLIGTLRLVPGVQVIQAGARGGNAGLFIRGGESGFNKVLVDGVAVNDIGGAFDLAHAATSGIADVEVLRQPNSVLYGSDALAGVVSLTTRAGRTRTPELSVGFDGGTFATTSSTAGVGGLAGRLDYFASYARLATDNEQANNDYRNGTAAGRVGAALGSAARLTGTLRRTDTRFGNPNATSLYGVADDSRQTNAASTLSVGFDSQVRSRLQASVLFGMTDQRTTYRNPAPTGDAYDPFGFGANYLGQPVTVRGANGFTASGRAILDFGGTYPSVFESRMTRRALSGRVSVDLTPRIALTGGARVEQEQGFDDPEGDPSLTRHNGGGFVEARTTLGARTYVTAGVGVEHNGAFGEAVTPRVSLTSYLRQPSSRGRLGSSRLLLNAGTGIKAPSVFQEQSSLYSLVKDTPTGAGVAPIGPERSRSLEAGLEQGFAAERLRVRASYFHNRFDDLIEYLSRSTLPRAGVPQEVASAATFGAYVNSRSYRARGLELSAEAAPRASLRLSASYTFLDAVVTRAFSATVSENPAFSGVAIGAFSPLVGARPFRRPTHSGAAAAVYTRGRLQGGATALLVGARDDSTFLSDQDFGNSLLLPNRDLEAGYVTVDTAGSWGLHPRVRLQVAVDNLFNRRYEAAFGYPALSRAIRAGAVVRVGGDR